MKILTIHADFIEFEPKKKAIKEAEEISKEKKRVEECLVVFTAFEKKDEENIKNITENYVKEIKDICSQVNANRIVLYPYAHLSSNLGSPKQAEKVMKDAELILKKDYEVIRAPFGWYKAFDISCKGHPLSELSREFGPEKKADEESEALKAERKLTSSWNILDLDGKLHKISISDGKIIGFDFSKYPKLKAFCNYEMAKVRAVKQEPPHVSYMKKLELVDYEPGSDPGNLRYYPKGRFIKSQIENLVNKRVLEYGAMEIEAPIMYDFEHPSLKSYLNRFPARQYTIQTPNKKVFLRFAACFGQFLMMHDANFSYKQLPLKLYELTKYSFRVEQRGELTGLRRLRAFTMPDTHAFCADLEQAKQEMMKRWELSWNLQKEIGFDMPDDFEFAIRITRDFYDKNKDFIVQLVKKWGKPALVEMWEERAFYFITKYEWNFVDALDKASALTTDQIDVENAERYGIKYTDKDGKSQYPLILHCSPSGAIERVMYGLLEKAYFEEKSGKLPQLPLWLSPTQVRFIPVSPEKHLKLCMELADEFSRQNIRADIDDRTETLAKRVMQSQKEWVPFTVAIGDKELNSDELNVRDRSKGKEYRIKKKELIEMIKKANQDKPYKPLPLNVLVSKRPIFYGG